MDITKPSEKEFTLKMKIFSEDKAGQRYRLAFHTEEDIEKDTNIFLEYNDRILAGEVVQDKAKKALKEDFGVEKILDMKIIEEKVDEGILEYLPDETLEDLELIMLILHDPEIQGELGEIYVTWIEIGEEE